MPSCGCGVSDVVDELLLSLLCHQPENVDVRVAHGRAPGSATVIETAVA
jgi:hypothetical protein